MQDAFGQDHMDTLLKYAKAEIEPNFLSSLPQEDLIDLSDRIQKYAGRNSATPTALEYIQKHLTGTVHDHDQSSHGRGPVHDAGTSSSPNMQDTGQPSMGGKPAGRSVNTFTDNGKESSFVDNPGTGSGQIGVPSGDKNFDLNADRPEKSTAWDGRHEVHPINGQGESPNTFTDRLKITIASIGKPYYEAGFPGIPGDPGSSNTFTDSPVYGRDGMPGRDGGSPNSYSDPKGTLGARGQGSSPNSFSDRGQELGPEGLDVGVSGGSKAGTSGLRVHNTPVEVSADYDLVYGDRIGSDTRAPHGSE